MRITGHKTDSKFRRYAIVEESQKLEALERVQQHVANAQAERKIVSIG